MLHVSMTVLSVARLDDDLFWSKAAVVSGGSVLGAFIKFATPFYPDQPSHSHCTTLYSIYLAGMATSGGHLLVPKTLRLIR